MCLNSTPLRPWLLPEPRFTFPSTVAFGFVCVNGTFVPVKIERRYIAAISPYAPGNGWQLFP